jgi:hypothetical protein
MNEMASRIEAARISAPLATVSHDSHAASRMRLIEFARQD